jgi:hypothetical protein
MLFDSLSFLFNDLFVVTSNNRILYKLPLDTVWLVTLESAFITLRTPEKVFSFSVAENKEYQQWITQIKETIDSFNKKATVRKTNYTFLDGSYYDGEWVDGHMSGKGSVLWPNGNTYNGEFKNSIIEGQGVFKFSNGDIYEGSFKDGKFHSQGTLTLTIGIVRSIANFC